MKIKMPSYGAIVIALLCASGFAQAASLDVIFVGTWTTAPGSGNSGVGGPGMATGQRFVVKVRYDVASVVLTRDVLTEGFTDSGQDMSVIELDKPGNSLDIFVPMEGLDGTTPFIYVQNETDHFPAFISSPTLNFTLGSDISDVNNIIGLEFEGDFVPGANFNLIELYNTAAGPTAPINMLGQILNCTDALCTGSAIAIRGINSLAAAVDFQADAGPDIAYDTCAGSRITSSQIIQTNDLGAARSDGEDFIDAAWSEGGNPLVGTSIGNDIDVSFADSGLTSCTDTTVWNVSMTEQMTGLGDTDSLNVSAAAPPAIELLKQVSLNAVDFFDADQPSGPDVPVGIVGLTDATYRLIVSNLGGEILSNVLVEDATLTISTVIADLAVGETRVLESGDTGFDNLFQPMHCGGTPGNKSNIATVEAVGATSGTPVKDEDPANVRCIVGPDVQLLKQVSLDGVSFVDADTAATGPTGLLGADATYRLIVRNVGDEDLINVSIDDTTLGITSETIPDLPIGAEVVIDVGTLGKFNELYFPNRCDSTGTKINIAEANANGAITGTPVQDEDSANVNCEDPDADNDGVPDDNDLCPDTTQGDDVDANGCSDAQVDGDDDGVCDPDAESDGPSMCGGIDQCANTMIPEGVPTSSRGLGKNRWTLDNPDGTFTQGPPQAGRTMSFSTTDTAGCSCEQIIAELGLGKGHSKFGCSNSAMMDWVNLQ